MRPIAALYQSAPPPTGKRGRLALKGARMPSLAEIASTATPIKGPDGRERTAQADRFVCLWYGPLHTQQVVVVMIRNPGNEHRFDISLTSPAPEVAVVQPDRPAQPR
jgi:hypothetical protein